MEKVIQRFIRAGFSVIPVRKKSKAPIKENWSALPTYSEEDFFDLWEDGMNFGIRPGEPSHLVNGDYAVTVDLDISSPDAEEDAYKALKKLFPTIKCFIEVVSGSKSGLSRHFIGTTDKPLRSRRVWRHPDKITLSDGRKKDKAQIEVFGTGKQHVGPGSMHPDGNRYEFADEEDFNGVISEIRGGDRSSAFISHKVFEDAGAARTQDRKSRLDGLEAVVHNRPVDLTDDELFEMLDNLPSDRFDDYQAWMDVGAALKLNFPDDPEFAKEVWHWFSKKSDKYEPDVLEDKWDTIHNDKGTGNVTLRTLIGESNERNRKRERKRLKEEMKSDAGEDDGDGDKWLNDLDQDDKGRPKVTLPNLSMIIANDKRLKGLIAFNELFNCAVLLKPMRALVPAMREIKVRDKVNGDRWTDAHTVNLRLFLDTKRRSRGYGMKVPKELIEDAIRAASLNNSFDPVKDFIEAEEWDGEDRVAYLWADYLGSPEDEYHMESAKTFCIGAVARVYEPGHKFDFVPIMEGEQGKRKTTFVETLAGNKNWTGALHPNFKDEKKMVESMLGRWLLEMPELAGFRRADVQSIKHFVSSWKDTTRLSYERNAADFHRRCVFIGTTNDNKYLLDETGNRRYWPIKTNLKGSIDIERLRENVPQIWAEARELYIAMREKFTKDEHPFLPLYLKSEAAQLIAMDQQEGAMAESTARVWAKEIKDWFDTPLPLDKIAKNGDKTRAYRKDTTTGEVWAEVFEKDVVQLNAQQIIVLEHAMQIAGLTTFWKNGPEDRFGKRTKFRAWRYPPIKKTKL